MQFLHILHLRHHLLTEFLDLVAVFQPDDWDLIVQVGQMLAYFGNHLFGDADVLWLLLKDA